MKLRSKKNIRERILNHDALNIAMLSGAAIAILTASFTSFSEECETIPNEVFRLHILANSNSEDDQNLKYELRDYLISDLSGIFKDAKDAEEACILANQNIKEIEKKAQNFVDTGGYTYEISAEIINMYFTTRTYENITMPAGYYNALRLKIGKAEGKNWWCVMFPPLCLPAASQNNEPYFSKEVSKTIESGKRIEVRFAIFEWLENFFIKK